MEKVRELGQKPHQGNSTMPKHDEERKRSRVDDSQVDDFEDQRSSRQKTEDHGRETESACEGDRQQEKGGDKHELG